MVVFIQLQSTRHGGPKNRMSAHFDHNYTVLATAGMALADPLTVPNLADRGQGTLQVEIGYTVSI